MKTTRKQSLMAVALACGLAAIAFLGSVAPGLLECAPAWEGNWTGDCVIAWSWQARDGQRLLIAVNYAGNQSQCHVRLPFPDLSGRMVRLKDLMGPASYDRDGDDLVSRGLYLDLPPWSYHIFEMAAV